MFRGAKFILFCCKKENEKAKYFEQIFMEEIQVLPNKKPGNHIFKDEISNRHYLICFQKDVRSF